MDALSARGFTVSDTGSGTDTVSARDLQAADTGGSVEGASLGGSADKSASDTFAGVDAVSLLARSGIGDTASFAEAVTARWLTAAEAAAWPELLRLAALRFWLSRLVDLLLPRDGALVSVKDPEEYGGLLRRHAAAAGQPWLPA